ncbi:DUF4111 domain-containing protein [Paenibacillus sp. DS2015]|uniref:DUF4111 domain-containing protein n=1 Tax=Paenibacillus sp. DS2015 TaxID=3373917 RepID=UPI003D21ACDF
MASILHDVEGPRQEIIDNQVYYTLNLCRVLLYLKEGNVSSKKEGGEWGVKVLPYAYHGLLEKFLGDYIGEAQESECIC